MEKSISRKALEIIRCSQCYNFATGATRHYCMHPEMEEACQNNLEAVFDFEVEPGYIPEWCPLEDWPDE